MKNHKHLKWRELGINTARGGRILDSMGKKEGSWKREVERHIGRLGTDEKIRKKKNLLGQEDQGLPETGGN